MSDAKDNNNNDPLRQPNEELIQPTGFTPVDVNAVARKPWIKPVSAVISLVFLILVLLLWYVFSARSVFISVTPSPQQIGIQGGFSFKVGERYLMRPGDYKLVAELSGYHQLQEAFNVSEEQNQSFSFALKKLPGLISISSAPQGAQITADGELLGETPLKDVPVAAGERNIEVTAERYLPQQHLMNIEGKHVKQSLQVELVPAWSEYEFNSRPSGAELSVNGEVLGPTPLTVELLQGTNEVALALQGYKEWRQIYRVEPNQPKQPVQVDLEKLAGAAYISSNPSEANITVNGEFRGQTPMTIELEPDRDYQIGLFKPGYQAAKQSISVKSGIERQLNLTLKPIVAQIKVTSYPGNAKVYVEGKYLGLGNRTFSLPTQKQKLEVRLDGYVPYQTYVTPREGLEQEVKVRLKTLEQAKWDAIKKVIVTGAGQELKLFRPNDTFFMGASRREAGRRANEALTEVKLTRAFYLGSKEVTNEQYRLYVDKHSSGNVQGNSMDGDSQPVVKVSWQEAALYCNWLSERDGLPLAYQVKEGEVIGIDSKATGYRLPTEAEWAWAARKTGNGLLKYPWGAELPPVANTGNYADRSAAFIIGRIVTEYDDSYVVTAPVGSFSPNHHGLYDLGGNVSEWINDYYATKVSISNVTRTDPLGPEEGKYHVIRGSSWAHGSITELRLSYRDYGDEGRNDVGFRIARFVE